MSLIGGGGTRGDNSRTVLGNTLHFGQAGEFIGEWEDVTKAFANAEKMASVSEEASVKVAYRFRAVGTGDDTDGTYTDYRTGLNRGIRVWMEAGQVVAISNLPQLA